MAKLCDIEVPLLDAEVHLLDSKLFNEDLLSDKKFMILRDGEKRGFWKTQCLKESRRLQSYVMGEINQVPMELLMDTGADVCLMKSSLAKNLDSISIWIIN